MPFPDPLLYYQTPPLPPLPALLTRAQVWQDVQWIEAYGPSTKRRHHWALVIKLLAKARGRLSDLATTLGSEIRPLPRKPAPALIAPSPSPLSPPLAPICPPSSTGPLSRPSPLDSRLSEGLKPVKCLLYDQSKQRRELLAPKRASKGGDLVHFYVAALQRTTLRRALKGRSGPGANQGCFPLV